MVSVNMSIARAGDVYTHSQHTRCNRRAYEDPSNPEEEIQKMISDVDDDGSGTIGYEEPLGHTLLIEPLVRPRGQLKKAQRLSA